MKTRNVGGGHYPPGVPDEDGSGKTILFISIGGFFLLSYFAWNHLIPML